MKINTVKQLKEVLKDYDDFKIKIFKNKGDDENGLPFNTEILNLELSDIGYSEKTLVFEVEK